AIKEYGSLHFSNLYLIVQLYFDFAQYFNILQYFDSAQHYLAAKASVAILNLTFSTCRITLPQASKVAPVVTTSSTSNTCLFFSSLSFKTLKLPFTFS